MEFLFPAHLLYRPVITTENSLYSFRWTGLPLVHYLHEGMTYSQLKSSWLWSFHGPLLQPPNSRGGWKVSWRHILNCPSST